MATTSQTRFFSFVLLLLLGVASQRVVLAESVETIISNGSSDNRVDIVILGDGYTASEIETHRTQWQQFIQAMFAQDPSREYQLYFNVHRIDVISNQSGADHPANGRFVDTALDATYNCNNIERLIFVNYAKALAVINRSITPVQSDIKLVIVNDQQYGGAGGLFAVASVHRFAVEVILHELGHSLGLLGDEYGGGGVDCGSFSSEPSLPNITRVTNRSDIKWNYWIDPSPPIPTNGSAPGLPGLYEGASTCDTGYFRPTFSSKMRT